MPGTQPAFGCWWPDLLRWPPDTIQHCEDEHVVGEFMKMTLKRVGLRPDACPGPPGALSQPVGQELAQVAPHFLRVHARLAARGTVVTRTSGLSQIVHAPSPDLQLGPRHRGK